MLNVLRAKPAQQKTGVPHARASIMPQEVAPTAARSDLGQLHLDRGQ